MAAEWRVPHSIHAFMPEASPALRGSASSSVPRARSTAPAVPMLNARNFFTVPIFAPPPAVGRSKTPCSCAGDAPSDGAAADAVTKLEDLGADGPHPGAGEPVPGSERVLQTARARLDDACIDAADTRLWLSQVLEE